MTFAVHNEDCLTGMGNLAECSIDSIVTDPPYHLTTGKKGGSGAASHNPNSPAGRARISTGFMGKAWDGGDIAFRPELWQAALRIAKPGAHLLAFGGTRTFHRLTCAIEDAGWEVRDCLMWVYGSGFPKSLDVSKAIDKAAGAEREVVGLRDYSAPDIRGNSSNGRGISSDSSKAAERLGVSVTAPATASAREWSGWGTALKPAWEPIILARKPFDCTVAENVQQWGTGAMDIDGCRVETSDNLNGGAYSAERKPSSSEWVKHGGTIHSSTGKDYSQPTGRWPANLIHDGSEEVLGLFPQTISGGGPKPGTARSKVNTYAKPTISESESYGVNSGSAARFFYCAKASKADRDEGLEEEANRYMAASNQAQAQLKRGIQHEGTSGVNTVKVRKNNHPTVKPTSLMRYLCRLITPPGGIVCDPFTGSGSTGKAALLEGFRFIGFELEAEYAAIARARCAGVLGKQPLLEAV